MEYDYCWFFVFFFCPNNCNVHPYVVCDLGFYLISLKLQHNWPIVVDNGQLSVFDDRLRWTCTCLLSFFGGPNIRDENNANLPIPREEKIGNCIVERDRIGNDNEIVSLFGIWIWWMRQFVFSIVSHKNYIWIRINGLNRFAQKSKSIIRDTECTSMHIAHA